MNTFKTKQEVMSFLSSIRFLILSTNGKYYSQSGMYSLNHGEYGRPSYHPRKYKDGWGIHQELYYYPGTFNAPKSGRLKDHDLWILTCE